VAVGIAGTCYLFIPSVMGSEGTVPLPLIPVLVGLCCSFSWGVGAAIGRRFSSTDLIQSSALQMLCASAVLIVAGLFVHDRIDLAEFTLPTTAAMLSLIIGGSIIGFSSFLWLVRNTPTTIAGTYAFVNPIVSIAIGVLLLHERLTLHTIVATAVIISGVALMIAAPRPVAAR
ncbi:MAG TPA: EamA family transporter, partial [Candidatus Baltobacteraceae bacterium]